MGPIYGTQTVSVPPPPIGIGPHIRLFAAPAPPVPPAPGTGIPWGSGAFQGFARPAIPPVPASMMTPQPSLFLNHPPSNPPIQQMTFPNFNQSEARNPEMQHEPLSNDIKNRNNSQSRLEDNQSRCSQEQKGRAMQKEDGDGYFHQHGKSHSDKRGREGKHRSKSEKRHHIHHKSDREKHRSDRSKRHNHGNDLKCHSKTDAVLRDYGDEERDILRHDEYERTAISHDSCSERGDILFDDHEERDSLLQDTRSKRGAILRDNPDGRDYDYQDRPSNDMSLRSSGSLERDSTYRGFSTERSFDKYRRSSEREYSEYKEKGYSEDKWHGSRKRVSHYGDGGERHSRLHEEMDRYERITDKCIDDRFRKDSQYRSGNNREKDYGKMNFRGETYGKEERDLNYERQYSFQTGRDQKNDSSGFIQDYGMADVDYGRFETEERRRRDFDNSGERGRDLDFKRKTSHHHKRNSDNERRSDGSERSLHGNRKHQNRRGSKRDESEKRSFSKGRVSDDRRGRGAVLIDDRDSPAYSAITSQRGAVLIEDREEDLHDELWSRDWGSEGHFKQRERENIEIRDKERGHRGKGRDIRGGDFGKEEFYENFGARAVTSNEGDYRRGGSTFRTGRTGAMLIDDRDKERPILRDDRERSVSMTGSTGALLIEDCDSPGHEGHLRNHRGNRSSERLGKVQGPSSRDCLSGERSGRNRENWSSDKWSGNSDARKDRGQSLNDPYVNDDRGHGNRGRFHGDRGQQESESNQGQYGLERNSRDRRDRSLSSQRSFSGTKANKRPRPDLENEDSGLLEPPRFKRQRLEDQVEESAQCVRSGTPIIPDDESGLLNAESVAAWVRCSAADLYFRKDPKIISIKDYPDMQQHLSDLSWAEELSAAEEDEASSQSFFPETGNLETTKRMQDLEKKFDHDLVQRASRIKATQVPYEKPVRRPRLNFKHQCKKQHCHSAGNCQSHSSDDSDSDSGSDTDSEEEEMWMEEVRHKQGNPYRLHNELWYNEPGELNYGPLCRCSAKSRRFGIRHDIYPGEKPLPKCVGTSNNLDKLFHYKITVSPVTNFLTKHPTIVNFDGHEYMFEGFSIFSHKAIPKLPPCQVTRFNIIYTIHIIEEPAPENFSVDSLDLFAKFMFDEILELVDINWKGPGGDEHCRRFHIMPRFARPFPENGKEVLSMNDVFLYLLKASKPVVEPTELASLLKLDPDSWQHYVDGFRHMVVTCPGKRPSSIRIDQLDKQNCETEDALLYPLIIHHGNRPPQLSYAGDNTYRKKWKEYLKFRHLLWTRTKVSAKDKDKLDEIESELQKIRTKCTMKKEVTVEINSEGFLLTGIRSDICQHAMMLPVLFNHIRFHECLTDLEKRIDYQFQDKSLLQLALTHASYKVNYGTNPDHGRNSMCNCGSRHLEVGDIKIHQHTRKRGLNILLRIMSKMAKKQEERSDIPHNERLEFLGDAVVEFITSIHLFYMFPHADEGELTMYRGALVQNAHFAVLAEKLGLHEYLLYAHGPDLCHDGDLKHAMANCFEALMGALYLDGGIQVTDRVFSNVLFNEEDLTDIWQNLPKHPLQLEEPNGDRHWIVNSPALQKLVRFENDIGYEFYNIRLLAKAFTQRSVGYNRLTHGHNQRLEFLGDTVMQLVSSDYLFRHFPDHHEGHLTLLRSSLVNNKTQAQVAEELGMTNYVLRSKHEEMGASNLKSKEKADLLESVLGAMYVDGGIDICTTLCSVCFFPRLEIFITNQDWNDPKSQLQQSCLTLRDTNEEYPDIPVYKLLSQSGPTNTRTFKVAVYFRGKRLAVGQGRSIQQGEMKAAETALNTNKDMFNATLRTRMGLQ